MLVYMDVYYPYESGPRKTINMKENYGLGRLIKGSVVDLSKNRVEEVVR